MQIPAELEIARNAPVRLHVAEAERYTRWLATHHYENFNVVRGCCQSDSTSIFTISIPMPLAE